MKATRWAGRVVVAFVTTLALIGVVAAVARFLFIEDLLSILEVQRGRFLSTVGLHDPYTAQRFADASWIDGRYATNRLVTLLHVVPGGVLLILGPLQFSRSLRRRNVRFHRWSGRFVALATLVVVTTGLFFGVLIPYGGIGEVSATVVFGGFCVFAIVRAYFAIRGGQVALHREWMIRALAGLLGISTIRLVGIVLDVTLARTGSNPRDLFALSLWIGWLITLGAAEVWIRMSRGSACTQERIRTPTLSPTRLLEWP